jgi:hypothetical protein
LLWVTVTKSFRHDVIPRSEEIMESLAQADGGFTLTYVRDDQDMGEKMAPAVLQLYDGAIFANTTGDLPLPDKQAFLQWIASGKAFIGVHAAIDTFRGKRPLDPYIQMIGAEFKTHGDQAQVDCLNQDSNHPACTHLPVIWTIKDEIYLLNGFDHRTVHGLLTLNREPNKRTPGNYPIAWCKSYGRGRVFFTSLGHREDVWTNPDFQKHLLGGIRWALNLTAAGNIPGITGP